MNEEPEYNNFLKKSIDLKNIREERRKEVSKDSLFKSCKKKIQTTMIGALDTVEKSFGFLWGFDENDEITPEQKQLKEIYEEARAKILDKGNTQIRNLESEFSGYDINKKRYQINLPVMGKNNNLGEENDGQK
jgi:transcription termination factor Rho